DPGGGWRGDSAIFPRPLWAGVGGGVCARSARRVVGACRRQTPPPRPRPQGAGGYDSAAARLLLRCARCRARDPPPSPPPPLPPAPSWGRLRRGGGGEFFLWRAGLADLSCRGPRRLLDR